MRKRLHKAVSLAMAGLFFLTSFFADVKTSYAAENSQNDEGYEITYELQETPAEEEVENDSEISGDDLSVNQNEQNVEGALETPELVIPVEPDETKDGPAPGESIEVDGAYKTYYKLDDSWFQNSYGSSYKKSSDGYVIQFTRQYAGAAIRIPEGIVDSGIMECTIEIKHNDYIDLELEVTELRYYESVGRFTNTNSFSFDYKTARPEEIKIYNLGEINRSIEITGITFITAEVPGCYAEGVPLYYGEYDIHKVGDVYEVEMNRETIGYRANRMCFVEDDDICISFCYFRQFGEGEIFIPSFITDAGLLEVRIGKGNIRPNMALKLYDADGEITSNDHEYSIKLEDYTAARPTSLGVINLELIDYAHYIDIYRVTFVTAVRPGKKAEGVPEVKAYPVSKSERTYFVHGGFDSVYKYNELDIIGKKDCTVENGRESVTLRYTEQYGEALIDIPEEVIEAGVVECWIDSSFYDPRLKLKLYDESGVVAENENSYLIELKDKSKKPVSLGVINLEESTVERIYKVHFVTKNDLWVGPRPGDPVEKGGAYETFYYVDDSWVTEKDGCIGEKNKNAYNVKFTEQYGNIGIKIPGNVVDAGLLQVKLETTQRDYSNLTLRIYDSYEYEEVAKSVNTDRIAFDYESARPDKLVIENTADVKADSRNFEITKIIFVTKLELGNEAVGVPPRLEPEDPHKVGNVYETVRSLMDYGYGERDGYYLDGSAFGMDIYFKKQYAEIRFEVPEDVAKAGLMEVRLKTRGSLSDMALRLYDTSKNELAVAYDTDTITFDYTSGFPTSVGFMVLEDITGEIRRLGIASITYVTKVRPGKEAKGVPGNNNPYDNPGIMVFEGKNLQFKSKKTGIVHSGNTFTFSNKNQEYILDLGRDIPTEEFVRANIKVANQKDYICIKLYDSDMVERMRLVDNYRKSQYAASAYYEGDVRYIGISGTPGNFNYFDGKYSFDVTIESVTVKTAEPSKERLTVYEGEDLVFSMLGYMDDHPGLNDYHNNVLRFTSAEEFEYRYKFDTYILGSKVKYIKLKVKDQGVPVKLRVCEADEPGLIEYWRFAKTLSWYPYQDGQSEYILEVDSDKMVGGIAIRHGTFDELDHLDLMPATVTIESIEVLVDITNTELTFTEQPESIIAPKHGKPIDITVKAQGDGLKYSWYYKNANSGEFHKAGQYTDTFHRTSQTSTDNMEVYCVITDIYGNRVKSDTVKIFPGGLTVTKWAGVNRYGKAGYRAYFDVEGAAYDIVDGVLQLSSDNLEYCWYIKNTIENGGDGKFHKAGCTTKTFSRKLIDSLDGAEVYCTITDKYGYKANTKVTTIHIMK